MKLLSDLKIRTKFLLIPLVVAIGMALVAGVYFSILNARKAKLTHVVQYDLGEIEQLSKLFSQLSTNHSLLDMARQDSNTVITGVLHEFDRDVAQFRVLVGLTMVGLVVLTLLVANLLTHDIVSLTGIVTKVVMGDKRVEVPYVARVASFSPLLRL
jgi:hypothetical protein